MKNQKIILSATILVGLCSISFERKKESVNAKPNVIYIISDQFRQYSLGFWSQGNNSQYIQGNPDPVNTPHLNQIANDGIVFSRSVSNYPLCSPHRGMLLSGMYPDKNGATNNCRKDRSYQLKTNINCITDVFSKADYEVSYFGKCHWIMPSPHFDTTGKYVGTAEKPGGHFINDYDTYIPEGPDRHGIKYFFQLVKDDHYNPLCYSNDPKLVNGLKDGERYKPKRFSSELEADAIKDYLSNNRSQRDAEKPFFMMWSINPPHNPWTEKSTNMAFFGQYDKKGTQRLLMRANADLTVGAYAPYYFANVSAVDHFIGQVMEKLKELNLDKNTIVVFSSDHGEMLGSHGRTGKNVPEIESFAIPFVIKWEGRLKHRVEDLILSVPDIMPTLLGLAGLTEKIPTEVQGKNYSKVLLTPEKHQKMKPTSALFMQDNGRGIYTGKYMLVVEEMREKVDEAFCYDNEKDPYQLNKIPLDKLEKKTRVLLKKELYALLKNTNDRWYQERICTDFLLAND